MRMGILGGTFDPVHYGHLLMAESCREELRLDQIRFIPARQPPHKPGRLISPQFDRAEMLRLAISAYPEFTMDCREFDREGPSFTVDTLAELSIQFPEAQLYLIIGADSLQDLLTWRQPDRIAEIAKLVVCNRPGYALPDRRQAIQWTGPEIGNTVEFVRMPGTDVSATELRDRTSHHRSLRFLTPPAVEEYIRTNALYQRSTDQ
ncbi:MAG: nicotinate-nucleotide adenylyltransferase [Planctomycetaceae bacterium]|nr:nicotinate-nucleotide adenylyltransferase [Planctomycetaceae bacterium]